MITVQIEQKPKKPEYPRLKLDPDTGQIVLFTTLHTGTLLRATGTREVGYHTDSWCAGEFEDFCGSIMLTQEAG